MKKNIIISILLIITAVIINLINYIFLWNGGPWPFYHNDEILTIVKQKGGDEEFLNSFEFLLDYPKEANIGDMNKVVEILQNLPGKYNSRVEGIFDKLISRNAAFYDEKETWKKKIKK